MVSACLCGALVEIQEGFEAELDVHFCRLSGSTVSRSHATTSSPKQMPATLSAMVGHGLTGRAAAGQGTDRSGCAPSTVEDAVAFSPPVNRTVPPPPHIHFCQFPQSWEFSGHSAAWPWRVLSGCTVHDSGLRVARCDRRIHKRLRLTQLCAEKFALNRFPGSGRARMKNVAGSFYVRKVLCQK